MKRVMDQTLAREIMLAGNSVFLTGAAGAGKTFVLNEFVRLARDMGKKVAVTATTGLAATHLNGNTIHSWSGIGVHDELPLHFFDRLSKTRREQIERADILVIDEISMLHGSRLDLVDAVTSRVRADAVLELGDPKRASQLMDTPFGGLQVIMSGDFFQLPPVTRSNEVADFAYESHAWKELDPVICYLIEQHRQDDEDYLEILNALRDNDIRRRHAEMLLARTDASFTDLAGEATELHTTNVNADAINARKLAEIPKDEVSYEMMATGGDNYIASLKKSVLAPETLKLKIGALVMAIKNSPDRKFVNGSVGRVVDFEEVTDYPVVKFHSGAKVVMQPDTWELRDGDRKRAAVSQIPLRLAWAITVHKSQGMTLDAARVNLSRAFVPGMGYVALSRVRSLASLSLGGLNRMALVVSEEATNIDAEFRHKSREATTEFSHLRKNADRRVKVTGKISRKKTSDPTKDWQAKLAKMREAFPNAYRPWQQQDDDTLKEAFLHGESITDLSKRLGRHEGSIKMRLQKHFGEDVVQ